MTVTVASPHHVLAAQSRVALLDVLRAADHPLTVAEAATAVGVGESTIRFHLSLLVSAGLVTRTSERRASAGRPALRYAPAPAFAADGDPTIADAGAEPLDRYEQLAGVLAGQLAGSADPVAAARTAGQRWSAELMGDGRYTLEAGSDTIATVLSLMGRLGFDPEPGAASGEIRLHTCPFESVARQHRAVVCGVHLGMLEQTVAELGGDVTVESLEPFVNDEPLLCIARLVAARGLASRGDGGPVDGGAGHA
jgi:predicted ArsR family transcriptional regulator